MTHEDMAAGGYGAEGEREPEPQAEIHIGPRTDPSSLTSSTNFSSGTATIVITKANNGDLPTAYKTFADSDDSDPAARNLRGTARETKRAATRVTMADNPDDADQVEGTHAYTTDETYTVEVKYGSTWYSGTYTAAQVDGTTQPVAIILS